MKRSNLILARGAETRDCRLFVEERIWTERLVHLFNVGRRISDFFSWSEGAQRVVKKAGSKSTRAIQKGMQLTVMGSAVREGPATSPYGRRVRGKPTWARKRQDRLLSDLRSISTALHSPKVGVRSIGGWERHSGWRD